MFYFEHYLAEGGVRRLSTAVIVRTTPDEWIHRAIRDEILDVFPGADVVWLDASAIRTRVDLLIWPVVAPYEFPFHDVLYERLDELRQLEALRDRADHVMIYRVYWREAEVVKSSTLPALRRRRRLEGWLIRIGRRSGLARRLFRPRYPN